MRRLAVVLLAGVALPSMWLVAASPASLASPGKATPSASQAPQQPVLSCGQRAGDQSSPGTSPPWAQQVLGFQDAWQFTKGQGENVAVIDSGVSGNAQLGGRVFPEQSLTGTSAGLDCVDHGTGVAGIIAAAPKASDPFAGVAPAAHILSIKVTDQDGVDAGPLAQGIIDAVIDHAQVVNVSDQVGNTPALSDAVLEAARNDVVIVAAAGNHDPQTNSTGPFFPAEYAADRAVYPNVVSVGAVDATGTVPDFSSPVLTDVSVVAPGAAVRTVAPGNTFQQQDGTSFAAPFVAGVAALVRASHPNLSAAEVVSRIIATADGGTGAGAGRTGAGMVDPLQAVTAVLPGAGQRLAPSPSPASVSVARLRPPDRFTRMLVVSVTGGALGAAGLVVGAAVVIPAGRRRPLSPSARPKQAGARSDGPAQRLVQGQDDDWLG
ncbi:MAG TPA: S8 family serine peptidase [Streptosporangiaceae bacterium]|nr:S8 family serine peptidase [Streptosporangiaceae bacterium]